MLDSNEGEKEMKGEAKAMNSKKNIRKLLRFPKTKQTPIRIPNENGGEDLIMSKPLKF